MNERFAARVAALVCAGAAMFASHSLAGGAPIDGEGGPPDAVVVAPHDTGPLVFLDAMAPPDVGEPDAEGCQLCIDDRGTWEADGPEGDACDSPVTDEISCGIAGMCGSDGCSLECTNETTGGTWGECTVIEPECEGCAEDGDAGPSEPDAGVSEPDAASGWIAQTGIGRILGRPRRPQVGTFTTGAGVQRPHWGHHSIRFDELPDGACTTRAQLHSRARRALGIADDDPCITFHEEIRYNRTRGEVTECRIHIYAVARRDHMKLHGKYHGVIDGHRRGGMWLLQNRVPPEMFLRRRTTRAPGSKPDEVEITTGPVCNGPQCGACEACCVENEDGVTAAEGGCNLFCSRTGGSCDGGCVGFSACGVPTSEAREVRPASGGCSCRAGGDGEGGVAAGATILLLFYFSRWLRHQAALRSGRGRRWP